MYKESPKGFKEVCTWYSTFTSVQGLVQFFASKNAISKAYWLLILAVATVATFVNVLIVFEDFFNYPVVTNVQVTQNSSIDFPSVTICNANRVHCGNLLQYVSTCQNVSMYFKITAILELIHTLEITFFTRVLIYLLPGICIYSLEYLETFC